MKITIREFIHSLLLGARELDQSLPNLKVEKFIWESWCFADDGAHYIPSIERTTGQWLLQ